MRIKFSFLYFQICPWSTIPRIIPGPAPSSSASHRQTVSTSPFLSNLCIFKNVTCLGLQYDQYEDYDLLFILFGWWNSSLYLMALRSVCAFHLKSGEECSVQIYSAVQLCMLYTFLIPWWNGTQPAPVYYKISKQTQMSNDLIYCTL